MALASVEQNKAIYRQQHDEIMEKRFQSPYPIRRYAHRSQYEIFLRLIPPGSTVLDAGCGEGSLSIMLAHHGCTVTGFDISEPNVAACRQFASSAGLSDRLTFLTGDIEHIPAGDRSFDYVVSSHVLEHVPDFVKGATELARIARTQVIIAIPTCLSLGALALLGRDSAYWTFSRRSLFAIPRGALRVLWAFITHQEGVNEGYAGDERLIHIWRFPWCGRKLIEQGNLRVRAFAGSAYVFPYVPWLLPISYQLDRCAWWPVIRNFGHGTTYVCERRS